MQPNRNGKEVPRQRAGKLSAQERSVVERFIQRGRVARNVAHEFEEQLTFGQRLADRFARVIGSWRFIIIQTAMLGAWIALNITAYVYHWDPYPFILLNLAMSFQAAYAAPILMMSQNRQSEKDHLQAKNDYEVNLKAELEIMQLREQFADSLFHGRVRRMQQHQIEMLERLCLNTVRAQALNCQTHTFTSTSASIFPTLSNIDSNPFTLAEDTDKPLLQMILTFDDSLPRIALSEQGNEQGKEHGQDFERKT